MLEKLDPVVERHPTLKVLLGGEAAVYRGHDGAGAVVRDLYAALTEIRFEKRGSPS
jgi:hypothetical protein